MFSSPAEVISVTEFCAQYCKETFPWTVGVEDKFIDLVAAWRRFIATHTGTSPLSTHVPMLDLEDYVLSFPPSKQPSAGCEIFFVQLQRRLQKLIGQAAIQFDSMAQGTQIQVHAKIITPPKVTQALQLPEDDPRRARISELVTRRDTAYAAQLRHILASLLFRFFRWFDAEQTSLMRPLKDNNQSHLESVLSTAAERLAHEGEIKNIKRTAWQATKSHKKKGPHASTLPKIEALCERRAEAILAHRPIPRRTGKYGICAEISIDPRQFKKYAPGLYANWDDPTYTWPEEDRLETMKLLEY